MNANSPLVGIVMGSKSDSPIVAETARTLQSFDIPFEAHVYSAHRTPDLLHAWMERMNQNNTRVFIAAAGKAAHLPGVVASLTVRPVIGIPIETSDLKGLDSLLSIVQMPPGIPVATVAIGKTGARNAAILAAQIIANEDPKVMEKLKQYRADMRDKVLKDDQSLQDDPEWFLKK